MKIGAGYAGGIICFFAVVVALASLGHACADNGSARFDSATQHSGNVTRHVPLSWTEPGESSGDSARRHPVRVAALLGRPLQLARSTHNSKGQAARHQQPPSRWVAKRFRTSVMGARVRGTVERKGNDLRGVVYVYPPFGGKNTYHFTGRIEGDRVVAAHHSGHVFRGTIVRGQRVVGVVTTRRGHRIPLDVPVGFP